MSYHFQVISFADSLAGQEIDTKFAALLALYHYFTMAGYNLKNGPFWDHVDAYQDETEGLNTYSRAPIFECAVQPGHVETIRQLGFQVYPL